MISPPTSTLIASALLEYARTFAGSDQNIANMTGMSRTAINEFRRGERDMSLGKFLTVCEGLGINPCDAISGNPQGNYVPEQITVAGHTYTLNG